MCTNKLNTAYLHPNWKVKPLAVRDFLVAEITRQTAQVNYFLLCEAFIKPLQYIHSDCPEVLSLMYYFEPE